MPRHWQPIDHIAAENEQRTPKGNLFVPVPPLDVVIKSVWLKATSCVGLPTACECGIDAVICLTLWCLPTTQSEDDSVCTLFFLILLLLQRNEVKRVCLHDESRTHTRRSLELAGCSTPGSSHVFLANLVNCQECLGAAQGNRHFSSQLLAFALNASTSSGGCALKQPKLEGRVQIAPAKEPTTTSQTVKTWYEQGESACNTRRGDALVGFKGLLQFITHST